MGRNVSLREKIGEKCLLGRKVLGRNVLGRNDFWGETLEYLKKDIIDLEHCIFHSSSLKMKKIKAERRLLRREG